MIFDRLADGIQNHAKVIVIVWAIILCFAGYFAIQSGEVMSYDMNEMAPTDSESIKGIQVMTQYFPSSSVNETLTPILVIYLEDEDELVASLQFIQALNDAAPTQEKINGVVPMDPMFGPDGDGILMAYVMVDSEINTEVVDMTPDIRSFIATVKETTGFTGSTYLTGSPAIGYDMEHDALEDVSKIDPFTILMILVLVGLFFRSFITSATPPLTIGVAFVATMALIFFIGHFLNIFFITNMMILVSMMGAGCDYCIFIIARYREEMRSGKSHHDALHSAIVWAGESITISGVSVMIGFGALSVCSYSMISTMGICLALGILMALLAALTLIPSILQIVGDRIFWPTPMKEYKEGGKATKGWYAWFGHLGDRYFHASAEFSIKHAKAIAIVAILVSAPAAYVVVNNEDSYDMITAMLSGETGDGMEYIAEYADQGMVMPNFSIIEYKDPIATVNVSEGKQFGTLYWTDNWRNIQPDLDALCKYLEDTDKNIASADGAFLWDDMLEEIEEAGITDTDAKIQYIRENVSAKTGLVFNMMLEQLTSTPGMKADYIFEGPAALVNGILASMGLTVDWDAEVKAAEEAGLTDPKKIVDYAVNDLEAKYPDQKVMIELAINGGIRNILDDEILVGDTFTPMVDYIMNVFPSTVGGDYVVDGKATSGSVTYITILTATTEPAMSPRSMDSIELIEETMVKYVADHADVVVQKWDTGTAVVMFEVSEQVKEQFTMIEVLVIILIILMLLVVMRSYLIPLRSVLTIMMSIAWTLAVLHLVFVDIMGQEVLWMIPIILLVICLGLGMDYDILLTTRIKENVRGHGMSNDDAIRHAVTHTGSVITICGLIMGGAFGTLMISGMTLLQEFGFALCFAILVDALIVRTYIVPAIMHLLGDWNWKGPGVKLEKKQ